MKHLKQHLLNVLFFAASLTVAAQVGVGTTSPDVSAALDVESTTKGLLIPRMTTAQRTAITSPSKGLQVFDNTTNSHWYHNGTVWVELHGGSSVFTRVTGSQEVGIVGSTNINYNAKTFDTNNFFDLTNDRFTPTIAGYYLVSTIVRYVNLSEVSHIYAGLSKNGTVYSNRYGRVGSFPDQEVNHTDVVYLNGTTDYIQGYYNSSTGSPTYASMTIALISISGGG